MPELLFKTITQQSFTVEVENTDTIGQLKQKIEEMKGKEDYPAENQKLIFNGRVLEDESLVADLNFAPPKFIVIMVLRKIQKTGPPASSSAASTTDGKTAENKAKETAVAQQPKSTGSTMEVSEEHKQTVANIEAMGYPRQEVVRALQAAFFDAARAVEYLCNGIPENVQPPNTADESDDTSQQGLAFLANSPQFQQLRDMVNTDPALLPQIIEQISRSNPQLMEAIRTNQDEFLRLLNADGTGAAGQPMEPQQIEIPVTTHDREAINRLIGLGFPEPLVVEAYFACEKNEDLAVNYILARMEEEQTGAGQQGGQ